MWIAEVCAAAFTVMPMRPACTDVLIVEDDPFVADVLRVILEDYGFRATCEATGAAGVERMRHCRFAAVITDLSLPDISGFEVLSAAREFDPVAVVIMMTASGLHEARVEALHRGAAGFLSKPFSPVQLLDMLTAALDRRGHEEDEDHVSP